MSLISKAIDRLPSSKRAMRESIQASQKAVEEVQALERRLYAQNDMLKSLQAASATANLS